MSKTTQYIRRLKFSTPVHIGTEHGGGGTEGTSDMLHSDTLFSALYMETLQLFGEAEADGLLQRAGQGGVRFSSLLPYNERGLFLPKPMMYIPRDAARETDPTEKKRHKKLRYIAAADMSSYMAYLKNGGSCEFFGKDVFGTETSALKLRKVTDGDNELYTQTAFSFADGCGLYCVICCDDAAYYEGRILRVFESLGLSGIGGERSSGFGKFSSEVFADASLTRLLTEQAKVYMNISLLIPTSAEATENALGYSLVQRKGFVASDSFSEKAMKKLPVCAVGEGSCFTDRPEGSIIDVSPEGGRHSVYRYGMPVYVGVS